MNGNAFALDILDRLRGGILGHEQINVFRAERNEQLRRLSGAITVENDGGKVAIARELDDVVGERLVRQRPRRRAGNRVPLELDAALGQFTAQPALLFDGIIEAAELDFAVGVGDDAGDFDRIDFVRGRGTRTEETGGN